MSSKHTTRGGRDPPLWSRHTGAQEPQPPAVMTLARQLLGSEAEQGDSLVRRNKRIRDDPIVDQRERCDGFVVNYGKQDRGDQRWGIVKLRQPADIVVVRRLRKAEIHDLLIARPQRPGYGRVTVFGSPSQVGDVL